MALGWSEIRSRATTFAFEWKNQGYEKGQSQTFWIEFFEVFGISQKRVAVFEKRVKKIDGKEGFIDLLWKGVLLIEQKSRGKDLNRAYKQAAEYFPGLTDDELPRYILVSDFEHFKLYDLIEDTEMNFALVDLPSKVELFGFMIGFSFKAPEESERVSIAAAEKMAKLHDLLKDIGYFGLELEQYLVRLLFCLFADDTSIFEKNSFRDFVAATKQDGSDLAPSLDDLFYRLNVPEEKRLKIDDKLNAFPYVNGGLFADRLPPAAFNSEMRAILLNCCAFDWGHISPSIFGSMFQAAMSEEKRHELGAHYTEESNILKIVDPLFMNELNAEFEIAKTNKNRLQAFHNKLAGLKFLDPACGTGNFLIIAYRELRRLETKVLEALYTIESASGSTIQMVFEAQERSKVNVDQFYGIEIDEFACEIARLGMWLMDHQCNLELSKAMGIYYVRLPLSRSATIACANALQIDWDDIVSKRELNYILGNPPFVGARNMASEQKDDMKNVFGDKFKGVGNLDYVTAWYKKAAEYSQGTLIKCAFVSTNSITQGEQVALLWKPLFEKHNIKIDFAYRTFQWTSAARGKAAVHCVIVGFSGRSQSPLLKGGGGGSSADGGLPFLPRNKSLKQASRELRKDATKQENRLWHDFLRNFVPRFTRQRIVNNYILDFYCHEAALAIELDGSQHCEEKAIEYDKSRTEYLNGLGIEVMRFGNKEVDENFAGVCAKIAESVGKESKPPSLRDTPFQKGALVRDICVIYNGEVETEAANINPYLIDAPDIFIESRGKPISDVPIMSLGNQPIDNGNYLFTEEEKNEFLKKEPQAEKWFKKWIGSHEFINRYFRYILYLKNCTPSELRNMPESMKRIEAVRKFRLESQRPVTRELAETPRDFAFSNISENTFIVVPEVSSERRKYIPIGFLTPDILASNLVKIIPNATLYHFGILTSNVHMAWTRAVCGRLKSDYRYSNTLVYNNFVWCDVADAQKSAIEKLSQGVLDARSLFPGSSLADLYDPLTMPPELLKAHRALDRAVMQAYGFSVRDMTEENCVAELMRRYREITGG